MAMKKTEDDEFVEFHISPKEVLFVKIMIAVVLATVTVVSILNL